MPVPVKRWERLPNTMSTVELPSPSQMLPIKPTVPWTALYPSSIWSWPEWL